MLLIVIGLLGGGVGRETPRTPSFMNPNRLTLGRLPLARRDWPLAGHCGLGPKVGPAGTSLEIPWFARISRALGTFQNALDKLVSALVPCGLSCSI